jgi:hypothetical protein
MDMIEELARMIPSDEAIREMEASRSEELED